MKEHYKIWDCLIVLSLVLHVHQPHEQRDRLYRVCKNLLPVSDTQSERYLKTLRKSVDPVRLLKQTLHELETEDRG